jgi:magnesium transporter
MERFKRTTFFRNAIADDRELLDDIIIDNAQAIEMAHIYTNILSGLMDTFASVISNNLNNVMRTLTKITIVLMLPTLITSFYGMNINLPIQENPYAFAVITIVCILASVIAMTILTVKRRF